ncbi:hypothetical protein P152DRAFT_459151 [Eremomyces bilateralis CBS 781.70]|uniref:Uncharacterized protein n=1 Tax=Eremomyces bilateralis CBS 781.70 TaxID=1392243 RepID=A0A6G1G1J6_9PEZI|nr:uncharacterized protein P152DRAFT_459151 [Eremomyces bilateralis CBS 781.70]KAF1811679.1 hypothetical protein P152DRAFT_459151 [Eremomyces bilateralis CBS 781.70]
MAPYLTPGNILLALVALFTSTGCYLADWNETHIHNPSWPPHAKFHNGQTMSMGLLLGLLTAYYQFRSAHLPFAVPSAKGKATAEEQLAKQQRKMDVDTAAVVASLYWVTQASAAFYPGSSLVDPPNNPWKMSEAPQPMLDTVLLSMTVVGWWLERGRIVA